MFKKLLTCAAIALGCGSMWAQTEDVTSTYLTNAGFDTESSWQTGNIAAGGSANCKNVEGWTGNGGAAWSSSGALGYVSGNQINGGAVPSTNSAGTTDGGALGLSVGWGGTSQYTQKATLPKGVYKVSYAAYNVCDATQATNKIGVTVGSTNYYGTITSFTKNTWVTETIDFELSEETECTFSVGISAVSGGSGSNAKLLVDYIKLEKTTIDVSALNAKIVAVQTVVTNSTGDKTAINAALTTAQGIADAPESLAQVNQAVIDLNTAYETYIKSGAMPTEGNTIDMTFTIINPSFETGNYNGWTTTASNDTGAKLNSNATYTMSGVDGNYVFNTWSVGTAITQKITGLPAGIYTLSCVMATDAGKTFSLKGNDSEGTASSTDKGTGVTVTTENVPVTNGELTISAGTSDKYWYKVDNFQLKLVRALTKDDFPAYTLATGAMNKDIAAAQTQAENTYLTTPNLTNYNTLTDAISAANASVTAYTNIKAYYDMTSAKVAGDYSSYTTDYEAGNYETEADGIAAIKAIRNGIATSGMVAGADLTSLIDNPDFELGNTNYWKTIASSDTGVKKNEGDLATSNMGGTYYFNTWWQGTPITQNLGKLPAGVYELGATIASDGGTIYMTVNGGFIGYIETPDNAKVGITGNSVFTLAEAAEVTIGIVGGADGTKGQHKAFHTDGYWFYRADDFKLTYLGATAPENRVDGNYTLSTGSNYITRGGDSNTEAVMTATEDDALIAKVTTISAGIQTIQFTDNSGYMLWNGEMVYTDGTMEPKKTTHLEYWKVAAVEGGYTILNTQTGKYLATTTATRNEQEITVATLSDTPATWTLTSMAYAETADYTALNEAIVAVEAKTLGFAAGEYAPYNNVTILQALVAAKEIDQKTQNLKKAVNEATNALTNATWTANEAEVNAVYDGSFNLTTIVRDATSYLPTGWTNTGYNTRVYKDASANAGIAATSKGACLFAKFTTEYGTETGYTMPLKAGTYSLKFIYGGWNEVGTRDIKVYNAENNATVIPAKVTAKNNTAHTTIESWSTYDGMIIIPADGDYVLSFYRQNTNAQNQICISDIELYSTKVERKTATAKYGTICLPYVAQVDGATLYSAAMNENGDGVTLTTVETAVAGTPYIYQATADAQSFSYTSGSIVSAPVEATPLVGVFTATAVPVGAYVMQTKGDDQKFYKVAEGSQPTLSANKAYLTVPATEAKALNIALAGEETAIKAIDALVSGDAKIYDLNGRELKSLQKGVNIVNGVKVFVK